MKQRIVDLDIIRGYALFGILVCNIALFNYPLEYFSAYFSGDLSWFDQVATYIRFNFFGDKTFSVFSLLFGVGIGMQYYQKSNGFEKRYSVRLLLLLVIGLLHALLLWYGDILTLYAILGLIVLVFIRLPVRYLVTISAVSFLWPTIQTVLIRNGLMGLNFGSHQANSLEELIQLNTLKGLAGHLKYNLLQILPTAQFYLSSTLYHSLSMIVLGVAIGKSGIIYKMDEQVRKYWILLYITGSIVVIWNIYQIFFFDILKMTTSSQFYIYWFLFNLSLIGQTFFVVSAIVLLLRQESRISQILKKLRFLGQMSLTNYLMHSVIGIIIFKMLGFFGESSPGIDLILSMVITMFQIIISKAWLAKYGIGPIEGLWRRMSKSISNKFLSKL